jgi:hypothetical protein
MFYEAADYRGYYDHGATHMDSGHIDYVHATNKIPSDLPLLNEMIFQPISPDISVHFLSHIEPGIPRLLYVLKDEIPSRASPT